LKTPENLAVAVDMQKQIANAAHEIHKTVSRTGNSDYDPDVSILHYIFISLHLNILYKFHNHGHYIIIHVNWTIPMLFSIIFSLSILLHVHYCVPFFSSIYLSQWIFTKKKKYNSFGNTLKSFFLHTCSV
jgi:hypothetical protein